MTFSLRDRIEGDKVACAALVLTCISVFPRMVNLTIENGRLTLGLSVFDPRVFGEASGMFLSTDIVEVIAAMFVISIYFFGSVFYVCAFGVAPAMLFASVLKESAAEKKRLVTAALVANLAAWAIITVVYVLFSNGGFPISALILQVVVLTLFLVCASSSSCRKEIVVVACVLLSLIAFIMLILLVPPFGSVGYGGYRSYFLSTLVSYISFWVLSALAIASLHGFVHVPALGSTQRWGQESNRAGTSIGPASCASVREASVRMKELKVLNDNGLITQDEFDAMKKELLGLLQWTKQSRLLRYLEHLFDKIMFVSAKFACGQRFLLKGAKPMDTFLEILAALAAASTILRFVLDEWREYRHGKRTTREIKKDRD